MLDLGRYLLGVAQILLLAGLAGLGATAVRRRLVPELDGATALLATLVLAAALLVWPAELLGTFGGFEPLPYLLTVAALGVCLWTLLRRAAEDRGGAAGRAVLDPPDPLPGPAGRSAVAPTLIALAIAAAVVLHFADGVRSSLDTGMTGFDSTWYHAPFAAGFFQTGDTWSLHFIAPQFLAWFYPANSELFHAIGMSAFDRDLLSPLLNLGWLLACLLACWCIGRAHRVAPWSLGLGAIALGVPAFSDQAGEARNDVVGLFFLLAAVAVALAAHSGSNGALRRRTAGRGGSRRGLAAGLAAGTKLNLLLPAAVARRRSGGDRSTGRPAAVPRGRRSGAAAAGGGYWYLRNLAHTGNPLPWFDRLGPARPPGSGPGARGP